MFEQCHTAILNKSIFKYKIINIKCRTFIEVFEAANFVT